jgi:hypothetical protein
MGDLNHELENFFSGKANLRCASDMICELIGLPLCCQQGDGDEPSIVQRQFGTVPNTGKEVIDGELADTFNFFFVRVTQDLFVRK